MFQNAKVFKSKDVKTRIKHECIRCGNKFPVGTNMNNTTFSYDNRLVSVYFCFACSLVKYAK